MKRRPSYVDPEAWNIALQLADGNPRLLVCHKDGSIDVLNAVRIARSPGGRKPATRRPEADAPHTPQSALHVTFKAAEDE